MKKVSEFDDILNECLERLFEGETVEQCLADYPEYAVELEPLLRTAMDAREVTAIKPRSEFRDRARYQFQAAVREMEPRTGRGFFSWQPRWVMVIAAVVALLVAGGGTVAAASNSLPDEPLYPVKLATEAVRLALTPSALGKAELYVKLADKRVDEIIKMADKGKLKQVERATERLNTQLIAMANLAVPAPALVPEPGAEEPTRQMEAPLLQELPSEEAPPPIIELPPRAAEKAPVAVPRAPGQREDTGRVEIAVEPDELTEPAEQALLKMLVSRRAVENTQALQAVLERVPESLKPALRRALEVLGAGYEEALRNLE